MPSFQFAGFDYPTRRDWLAAVAQEWMTAGGANDEAAISAIMANQTDQQLANDCLSHWPMIDAETAEPLDPAELAGKFAKLRS